MAVKPIQRVLVIKLGGVGEMVLAFPAFERIRQEHPRAKITLLTTQPFEALAKSSPYFNTVDAEGAAKDPASWTALILRIRHNHFDRVYDRQNDASTNLIFQALRPLVADPERRTAQDAVSSTAASDSSEARASAAAARFCVSSVIHPRLPKGEGGRK